jgi:hypothetical protein
MSFYYPTSSTLENCTFYADSADDGGAIWCSGASPTLTNCTIFENSASQGGGLYCTSSSPVLQNCIVAFSPEGEAVHCPGATDDPTLTCCDLYGNSGGDWIGCIADQAGINGNFSLDPLFCDTSAADFRLDHISPCTPENNECGSLIGSLGIGCAGTNQPPDTFSLLFPPNKAFTPHKVYLDWESAVDPDLSDPVRYDLYISTSRWFSPESTSVDADLPASEHTRTLDYGRHYWKVKAHDDWGGERWCDGSRFFVITGIPYSQGDFNRDGSINLGDVVFALDYLYKEGPPPDPLELGDSNCDGAVDLGDAIYILNYLFKGGPPPGCP